MFVAGMRACIKLFLFSAAGMPIINAQVDTAASIVIDFNDHTYNEKHNKLKVKAVEVSLVRDRFGNEKSALYLHGTATSYLNLGTSNLLKPKFGTISLWVKLDRKVFAGKGYESNPVIQTKNSWSPDFYDAYALFYDLKSERFMYFSSKDSTGQKQAGINSLDNVVFNRWYYVAMVYDNQSMALYIDGVLQGQSAKNFEITFQEGDSVTVGNGASRKNDRWMRGTVDDIMIFNKVLSNDEIQELYKAPDPNKIRRILKEVAKYAMILAGCGLIILIIIIRNRIVLKREKEKLELEKHIAELEMKVVKTQMNPHFISNCLAAIQELIYKGNVDKAGQYLAKFSLFLRQLLDYSDKTYISLEEELEIIKLNIELEQLRFKDNFDFNINIRSEVTLKEIMIPSLITQPLVENAIWHGLLPLKDRKPWLGINVYLKEHSVFIEIEDNGVGRKKEENKNSRKSRGTKLVKDKLDSISKLTESKNYRLHMVDLFDENGLSRGTRMIIQLDNLSETL